MLLAEALDGALELAAIWPEGLDDIDCELADGSFVLVQSKERAAGRGNLTASDVARVISRAASSVLRLGQARIAIATDADLGSDLQFTGWQGAMHSFHGTDQIDRIVNQVEGVDAADARRLVSQASLVSLPWQLESLTRVRLAASLDLPPAVAGLVYARLVEDLVSAASNQREHTRDDAIKFRPADVRALAERILEAVDVDALDEAVRLGVAAQVDFSDRSELTPETFLEGVDVMPSHIAAGLDLPRPDVLGQIADGLTQNSATLLVGPSGSGKSALLWRAAREYAGAARVLRLLRLETPDVPTLLRYVHLQQPSRVAPVLVCADDLGRSSMSGWPHFARQALGIPHLLLLGASRQEDFTPELAAGRSLVVEPRLSHDMALAVASTLASRGIRPALDAGEAFEQSGGLLMEYLALVLSGRRLAEVVAAQVDERLAQERSVERELLRLIGTADALGVSVSAASLRHVVTDESRMPAALRRLRDEHLAFEDASGMWSGMHELRSKVILEQSHRYPPPTLQDTLTTLIERVDVADVARVLGGGLGLQGSDPKALARTVGGRLSEANPEDAATLLGGLLDADAIRWARASIEAAESAPMPGVPEYAKVMVATHLASDAARSTDLLPAMTALSRQMPDRPESLVGAAMEKVPTAAQAALVARAPSDTAARIAESLAQGVTWRPSDVRAAWDTHRGDGPAVRARLIAAFTILCAEELGEDLGTVDERFASLVVDVPNAVDWGMSEEDDGLVAKVTVMAPNGDAHAQAVEVCQWILGCLPEVGIAEVETIAPDGEPLAVGDFVPAHKRIPRRNLPGVAQVDPNARHLDAVRRLLAVKYWTARLRDQAEVAAGLVEALQAVPVRVLHPYDNPRRAREWRTQLDELQRRAAMLPPPPIPGLDRNSKDHAHDCLLTTAQALQRIAEATVAGSAPAIGIAAQLRDAHSRYLAARDDPVPVLADVGDPMSAELGTLLSLVADLVIVLQDETRDRTVPADRDWLAGAERLVATTRQAQLDRERGALEGVFDDGAVTIRSVRHDAKEARLVTDRWLVVVPLDVWEMTDAIEKLAPSVRQDLAFRCYFVAEHAGQVVPRLGFRIGPTSRYPLDADEVAWVALALDKPLFGSADLDTVVQIMESCVEASRLLAVHSARHGRLPAKAALVAAQELISDADSRLPDLPAALGEVARDFVDTVRSELEDGGESIAADLASGVRSGQPGAVQQAIGVAVLAAVLHASDDAAESSD